MLVHCKAGISRSSTLVAATLAAEESLLRAALDIVHEARPRAMPNPALHEQAVLSLAARS